MPFAQIAAVSLASNRLVWTFIVIILLVSVASRNFRKTRVYILDCFGIPALQCSWPLLALPVLVHAGKYKPKMCKIGYYTNTAHSEGVAVIKVLRR